MEGRDIVTLALAIIALFGGAFGVKLLDKWFDRDKARSESMGAAHEREFADNEQARRWLQEQLRDRDGELEGLRKSERALLERVGQISEQMARLEERSAAQALQITALQQSVAKWGADYAEMKAERDAYRDQKHTADNKLTSFTLRAQIAERDLAARDQEIERLRGQVDAITRRPVGGEP